MSASVNVVGANERIRLGFVGLGFSIGQNHLFGISEESEKNNVVIAAACDVFEVSRAVATKRVGLREADMYVDYRELLERKDLDAVLVSTHDPLHGQICLDSLDAGKHVYCERPLTRYLSEAFKVFDKVKSSGRVFQLGVQSCSSGGWQKCAQLVRDGEVGALVWGQGKYCTNAGPGCDGWSMVSKESTPTTIDWSKWLGPVRARPFSAAHFHQWRLCYDYSAGLLASQAPRALHPLMLARGNPEFPTRVSCVSGHGVTTSYLKAPPGAKQVPAHVLFLAEFPAGDVLEMTCSWLNSCTPSLTVYGHMATLSVGPIGDRVELTPEKEFANKATPETFTGLAQEDVREHEKDWFHCIRSGKTPRANIDLAIRAQTVLSLAEMSDRLKITCLFNEETRRVTDGAGNEIKPISYETSEL